eukprot:COSAG02_NODE_9539_length_2186_cov_1.737422_4_plen_153_part_00
MRAAAAGGTRRRRRRAEIGTRAYAVHAAARLSRATPRRYRHCRQRRPLKLRVASRCNSVDFHEDTVRFSRQGVARLFTTANPIQRCQRSQRRQRRGGGCCRGVRPGGSRFYLALGQRHDRPLQLCAQGPPISTASLCYGPALGPRDRSHSVL